MSEVIKEAEENTAKELSDILNNEEQIQNALYLASQIEGLMGKNWFTVTSLARKAKIDIVTAGMKMETLKLFGNASFKLGDFRDGKKNMRIPMYKISISKEAKISALDDLIAYHNEEIAKLEVQKKNL